ncbi:MAG TPA: hypothetical protein VE130_05440 [Nitrososphaeraceae archaeon]|nr:hypothetical protein [Nitrososphaeraceae archaeon]
MKEPKLKLRNSLLYVLGLSVLGLLLVPGFATGQAFAERIPFAMQSTAASEPDMITKMHEQAHQAVQVLPKRDDGKFYTGTLTYVASIPVEVVVLQPLNQTVIQNATTTPFTQPGLNSTIALFHQLQGALYDTIDFSGSEVFFHSRSPEPFTVSYSVVGEAVDPEPLTP